MCGMLGTGKHYQVKHCCSCFLCCCCYCTCFVASLPLWLTGTAFTSLSRTIPPFGGNFALPPCSTLSTRRNCGLTRVRFLVEGESEQREAQPQQDEGRDRYASARVVMHVCCLGCPVLLCAPAFQRGTSCEESLCRLGE